MLKYILVGLVSLGFISFLTFQMLSLAQTECRLCIEFKGRKECPQAFGPTREQALEEAHRNACAVLASGVTEVLACNRAERTEISCEAK